jgi:hypothetical protein
VAAVLDVTVDGSALKGNFGDIAAKDDSQVA